LNCKKITKFFNKNFYLKNKKNKEKFLDIGKVYTYILTIYSKAKNANFKISKIKNLYSLNNYRINKNIYLYFET
jgi:hypothetical protein